MFTCSKYLIYLRSDCGPTLTSYCNKPQTNMKSNTYEYAQGCQWDARDRACQRDWLRRQHNKFCWKSRRGFFFSEDSKETCPLIFVSVIRKVKSWIEQDILLLLFICKIHVISCCKVLKFSTSNFSLLFNPSRSFSELQLLLTSD